MGFRIVMHICFQAVQRLPLYSHRSVTHCCTQSLHENCESLMLMLFKTKAPS